MSLTPRPGPPDQVRGCADAVHAPCLPTLHLSVPTLCLSARAGALAGAPVRAAGPHARRRLAAAAGLPQMGLGQGPGWVPPWMHIRAVRQQCGTCAQLVTALAGRECSWFREAQLMFGCTAHRLAVLPSCHAGSRGRCPVVNRQTGGKRHPRTLLVQGLARMGSWWARAAAACTQR